jgi:predicted dehydrogenase
LDARAPVIAVVGCGRWGGNIVRDLVVLGCTVVAVDPVPKRRALADATGAARSVPVLGACGAVDGAVVAVPTSLHAAVTAEVLELGVPTFVEKPLTDDPSSAADLVVRGGDRLFVMHKWYYHPGVEALADLATVGRLGDLVGVTSERIGVEHDYPDADATWILGPHELTIGQRIIGTFPEPVAALADVTAYRAVGLEVICRTASQVWHRWSVSTRPLPIRRQIVVHGTRAVGILADPYARHVEIVAGDGALRSAAVELIDVSPEYPLLRELRTFRDHLRGGPPPPTTGVHGLVVECISRLRALAGLPPAGSAIRF